MAKEWSNKGRYCPSNGAPEYRWAFGPPGQALAWARGSPLNFVSGQPVTNSFRVVSCPSTVSTAQAQARRAVSCWASPQ
jgi:hypothetical protein